MKINEESWHYRLIKFVTFRDSQSGRVPTSLCPYVRAVFYRLAFFGTVASGLCALLIGLFYTPMAITLAGVGITNVVLVAISSFVASVVILGGLLAVVVGLGIGIAKLLDYIMEKRRDKAWAKIDKQREDAANGILPPEPGLIKAFLQSKHDKICPKLTFVKGE